MVIISFELFFIVFFVLALCADSLVLSLTVWIAQNWITVKIIIYAFFLLIVLIEVLQVVKQHLKSLICWFAGWNTLRSIIAAEYLLFLLSDLAENYSAWGLAINYYLCLVCK